MRKENPIQYSLKHTTVMIVEELYCTGKHLTYKAACQVFFNTAKQKNQATGFCMDNFVRFYQNYRNFKHKHKVTKQNNVRE